MASFILGKRDLRTRSRTTVADKKSKKGKSAAAQKLEALYKQDIENEEFDRDDEKDFLETDEATLNRKNEIDEGVGQHLVIQHLLNDVESNRYDFEGSQNLENIVTDEAMSKKEKKCCKRYDEMKKDFATMNDKVEQLGKEWKIVKRIIQRWGPQPGSSDEMDDENYDELPRFPLKKVKHVNLMYENINNPSYKKQLIAKLRTFGGATIKKNVSNIFKRLFSSKLKTRFCWKGSSKKVAFEKFDRIIDVIRQAVKSRHKSCKLEDIEKECKLRFKQAEKDFEREQLKHSFAKDNK